jgi:hypothetical protein
MTDTKVAGSRDSQQRSPIQAVLPWAVALIGLAVPMVGGHLAGWPIAVGWFVVLLVLGLVRPVQNADRPTRVASGVGALVLLVVFIPLGGLYLLPAAIIWTVLAYREPR